MNTVKEIQDAIKGLSSQEFDDLKRWIAEIDCKQWDREIEQDSEAGKLDFLSNGYVL